MRQLPTNTHSACRSLIQKAVRRGDVSLTRKVASHLREIGDANWLTSRTAVITFEECWPLAADLKTGDFTATINCLIHAAQSVKVKDATGLGTLAYALANNDRSVLSDSPEDGHIKIVAEAIKRPKDFWEWVSVKCADERQRALVEVAQKAYRRGGWPWDKAFMQAAAYLAITEGLPDVRSAKQQRAEFPFWVALDKHTPQGKQGLREAAKRLGVPIDQLFWVSFYCESALTNEATDSNWWSKEVQWRLHQVGLEPGKAHLIWERSRSVVAEILKTQAEQLQEHLATPIPVQLSLFDQTRFVSADKEASILSAEILTSPNQEPKIFPEETLKPKAAPLQEDENSPNYVQLELFEEI